MARQEWDELAGKVVMVTGASSGLGLEFCLDLAKAGCRIVAAARRVARLVSLCHQINHLPLPPPPSSSASEPRSPRAVAVELDVCADAPTIESAVYKAWDAFGHIDALVNNAGEEWNNVFKTNLTGAWLVSKYVCIRMRDARRGGSIINISSIAGINRGQNPGAVAYASSKAGLNALTKAMALELGVHKIRVNSIAPGIFKSEITDGLMQKSWLPNVVNKTVPLRTYGTSDPALTSMVRYLIHDSSEYVSGNIFIVDAERYLKYLSGFSVTNIASKLVVGGA
ncbi:hypothetical protein FH972_016785 [Carpinus fangiana]|uniref:Ketoreductase domain-containing protein n=1 Tax=Carpinus fangiana TaxID=176857 RepID=A0A5N6RGY6_9ROSI|nr:hypothetical protein FH972_016785 [Carpinus fangiana]